MSRSHVTSDAPETDVNENTYIIRPNYMDKFKPQLVSHVIHEILEDHLKDKAYDMDQAPTWCKTITEVIKEKVKELEMNRYKLAVNVIIGEQRGQGIKVGCRCFWDSDTDNYAQDIYMNDSLFCHATVFGVFYY